MVTNYPIASRDGVSAANHAHTDGPGVLDRMRQMLCGLHGHDTLLHFEQHRLSLRCASCGHETTGWTIAEDGSRARAIAPARRRIETRHAA